MDALALAKEIVAGRRLHRGDDLNAETKLNLCASMGFLTREQFKRLRAAGVTSYHHNIETSQRNFPNICTTHSYQMKMETIKIAQSEGFCVCSGGIIGMGETWEDRLDMAISLYEAGVQGDREMLSAMGRDVHPVYGSTCGNHDCACDCCGPADCGCDSTCDCSGK